MSAARRWASASQATSYQAPRPAPRRRRRPASVNWRRCNFTVLRLALVSFTAEATCSRPCSFARRSRASSSAERGSHEPLPFHLALEHLDLLAEAAKEEHEPLAEPLLSAVERGLGSAQRPVVVVLVLLDDPLQRAEGCVLVSRPQEEQGRDHARKAAVAVLEWWMARNRTVNVPMTSSGWLPRLERGVRPGDELLHLARSVEGGSRLEHDAQALPIRPEGLDVVGKLLVVAAVTLILGRVLEKEAVQLLHVVLGEGQLSPGLEDESIASA